MNGCAFVQATVEVGNREPLVCEIALRHKARFADALKHHLCDAGFARPEDVASQIQLLAEGATTLAAIGGDAEHARRAERAAMVLLEAAWRQT